MAHRNFGTGGDAATADLMTDDELLLVQKMSAAVRSKRDGIYERALALEAGILANEVLELRALLGRRRPDCPEKRPSEN